MFNKTFTDKQEKSEWPNLKPLHVLRRVFALLQNCILLMIFEIQRLLKNEYHYYLKLFGWIFDFVSKYCFRKIKPNLQKIKIEIFLQCIIQLVGLGNNCCEYENIKLINLKLSLHYTAIFRMDTGIIYKHIPY